MIYDAQSVTFRLPTNHKYLLFAEWNRIFKQTPDNNLIAARCSEGAMVAEVSGHILRRSDKHLEGHTLQCCAVC